MKTLTVATYNFETKTLNKTAYAVTLKPKGAVYQLIILNGEEVGLLHCTGKPRSYGPRFRGADSLTLG